MFYFAIAAAIAYGLGKKFTTEKDVVVLDLGGGIFHVSCLFSSFFFGVISTFFFSFFSIVGYQVVV
jgi:molecular chaperone DnaK (HSP70)